MAEDTEKTEEKPEAANTIAAPVATAVVAAKKYIATTGIDNEILNVHLAKGDDVPANLVEAAPWLIEDGTIKEA